MKKAVKDADRQALEKQISDLRNTVFEFQSKIRRGNATRDLLVQEHNSVLRSLHQAIKDKEDERRLTQAQLEEALVKARADYANNCATRDAHHRLQLENALSRHRLDKEEAAQKEHRLRQERDTARADADRLRACRDKLYGELLALKAKSSEQAVQTAVASSAGARGL